LTTFFSGGPVRHLRPDFALIALLFCTDGGLYEAYGFLHSPMRSASRPLLSLGKVSPFWGAAPADLWVVTERREASAERPF